MSNLHAFYTSALESQITTLLQDYLNQGGAASLSAEEVAKALNADLAAVKAVGEEVMARTYDSTLAYRHLWGTSTLHFMVPFADPSQPITYELPKTGLNATVITVSRDGVELKRFEGINAELDVFKFMHKQTSQSISWAIRHEGFKIEETSGEGHVTLWK